MNRRFFLKGLGGAALAIPTLTSLLPRTALAQTTPVRRYVQLFNPYGPTDALFYGNLSATIQAAANVKTKALSSVTGSLSPVLGTSFDAVKSKVSVLRGLDVTVNNPNHQYCFATTASGYAPGLDGDGYPPEAGNDSIDSILSQSTKVYAGSIAASRRLVNINPITTDDYSTDRSWSWQHDTSNNLRMLSPLKTTSALMNLFMGSFGMATMPQTDGRELSLMQAVHGDYTRVRNGPRISVSDKLKLDAYVALIADIEHQLQTQAAQPVVCAAPATEPGNDATALVRTQLRVLAAAMACDLTRVCSVTLGMSAPYDTRHTEHHALNGTNASAAFLGDLQGFASNIGWFMGHLDSIADTQGTLLDNAIVYWCMQYGCNDKDGTHSPSDMPVVVGGRGAGLLAQGNYVDFRSNGVGLPLNNLLVTFFNVMGLSSADYERSGSTGFGLYNGQTASGRTDTSTWTSMTGKRSAVPVLYTGPALL